VGIYLGTFREQVFSRALCGIGSARSNVGLPQFVIACAGEVSKAK